MTSSYPFSTWRLIEHGASDGAWNMAVDEAILRSVEKGAMPTLRFYAWEPPCLSLGRSQPPDVIDFATCDSAGVTWVRRPTGGGAILHTDELTYSICLPLRDPRAAGDILESYHRLSEALAQGLESLGLNVGRAAPRPRELCPSAACFETPAGHEIMVAGRKLVGSAQFRTRTALLQHGSLPLMGDVARIADFLALSKTERAQLRASLAARAVTLEEALGRPVSFSEASRALACGVQAALNVCLETGALTAEEERVALRLQAQKYGRLEFDRTGVAAAGVR